MGGLQQDVIVGWFKSNRDNREGGLQNSTQLIQKFVDWLEEEGSESGDEQSNQSLE